MSSEREFLGHGVVFSAWYFEAYNKVAKIPYWPQTCNLNTEIGVRLYQRTLHDHNLISNYLGDVLGETRVRFFANQWWLEQSLHQENMVSSLSLNKDDLLPQLQGLAERALVLKNATGFTLDWFGFSFWPKIPRLAFDPSYWLFPSLTFTNTNGKGKLELLDTGLLWTDLTKKPDAFVLPHEALAANISTVGLKLIETKTGIKFT